MPEKADESLSTPRRYRRRTQRERSEAMRSRLLEAPIDCLYDVGYSRTTTIEIAARAGVSRGAQLHHFPTKQHLVTVAVRHLLTKRIEEFRQVVGALPEGTDKPSAVIDILWEKTSNRAFYAWLELVVAGRTDPSLRKAVMAISEEFSREVHATCRESLSPQAPGEDPAFNFVAVFALAVMQGLALDHIVWPPEDPRIEQVLLMLKALAGMRARKRAASAAGSTNGTS
jgi:AcrR family transcriptional regulator